MEKLPSEEYVEQAYLFRAMSQRMTPTDPVQDMLGHLREEILATTKLPMAIDYLLAELNHVGTMSTAMGKLSQMQVTAHYWLTIGSLLAHCSMSC